MRAPSLLVSLLLLCLLSCLSRDGDGGGDGDGGLPNGNLAACEVNSDCVVVPQSCCGMCGAPTRGDAIAIRVDRRDDYADQVCDGQACPACAPLFIDPTLVATCRAGRCELVDLREHTSTECGEVAECRVRTPDCCECGGDTSVGRLIGVSTEQAYAALVCDPDQACPECAPVYPSEVTLQCDDGHCATVDARLPGM